jgi:hypothetical protein
MKSVRSITEYTPFLRLNAMRAGDTGAGYFIVNRQIKIFIVARRMGSWYRLRENLTCASNCKTCLTSIGGVPSNYQDFLCPQETSMIYVRKIVTSFEWNNNMDWPRLPM